MRKGGSQVKGAAFERYIASLFTKAYYPFEDGEFRRVPQSGGWDKRAVSGDLVALKYAVKGGGEMVIDGSFPFSVECKNWKEIKHFFSGLYGKESQLLGWMEQADEDASYVKKVALVVFKLFGQKVVAMIQKSDFCKLKEMFGVFPNKSYSIERHQYREVGSVYDLVLCLLDDFLEWLDWEVYRLSDRTKFVRSYIKMEKK